MSTYPGSLIRAVASLRPVPVLMIAAAMALALVVSGAFYFRRMEQGFADII